MKMTARRWALLMTAIDRHKRYLLEQADAADRANRPAMAAELRADAAALASTKDDLYDRFKRS